MRCSAFLALFFITASCSANVESVTDVSEATVKFALDVLKANGKPNENIFFSPASLSTAFGMVYAGSASETKEQLNKLLFSGLSDEIIFPSLKSRATLLSTSSSGYNLSEANRAYIEKTFSILPEYKEKLRNVFLSQIESADFLSQPEQERSKINNWVAEQTDDNIKDLLPSGSIDGLVKLVLVNAIYFKGNWKIPFKEMKTSKAEFFKSEGNSFQVDMMKSDDGAFVSHYNDKVKVVGVPYVGESTFMYFVVPQIRFGLKQVEDNLTYGTLLEWITSTQPITGMFEVQVPKFKMTKQLNLKEIMIKLNVTKLFTSADLSKITARGGLSVSDAFHKSAIEVNEKGSTAASSTAIVAKWRSAMKQRFVCDEPFLFLIFHKPSKSILFLGRFANDKFD